MGRKVFRKDVSEVLSGLAAVTPHDTNELSIYSRALYVGTAGDLKVTTVGGDTVTITNAAVGWHPIAVKVVFSTGTTASNIIAGY